MPVTVASAERFFSKLKLKKKKKETLPEIIIAQDGLGALAIISIEVDEPRSLDIETMIDQFAGNRLNDLKRFKV